MPLMRSLPACVTTIPTCPLSICVDVSLRRAVINRGPRPTSALLSEADIQGAARQVRNGP
jgi:hypothetical protein